MSTKSTIQALIDANLADASNITASEHRAVENALLNELYPTIINETHSTTNTVTTRNTGLLTNQYNISICKQGRMVTINGSVSNTSSSPVGTASNHWFFEITNSEYLPNSTQAPFRYVTTSGVEVQINFGTNRLFTSEMAGNTSGFFSITYFTAS